MGRFKVNHDLAILEEEESASLLSLYDKSNPDKNMFNLVDDEIIKLSGSEILVYKYYPANDKDDVYGEARSKVINNIPIKVFGNYDPRPLEENLTQFGVEVQNDQVFIFNKSHIERKLGRTIINGDILEPQFQKMKFEVFEVQEDSFESYGIYHLTVHAKLLRDNETVHQDIFNLEDPQGGKL